MWKSKFPHGKTNTKAVYAKQSKTLKGISDQLGLTAREGTLDHN